jgi:hypothetical protein
MAEIYVDIGPMDASKAPKQYAEKAKAAMENTVEKAVKGASGFTADKKGSGYSVRLKIAELKVEPKGVSCKLTGEIWRYPKAEMFTTSLTGAAKADGGKPDSLVADCIEGAVEGMMKRALPEMKKQARP